MKIKALKDYSWSIDFKAKKFIEGESYTVDDQKGSNMIKNGYASIVGVEKAGSVEENKAITPELMTMENKASVPKKKSKKSRKSRK